MHSSSRRDFLAALLAAPALSSGAGDAISLFDGRTLKGWRASENPGAWRVVDGALAADGGRSHLFYEGAAGSADFRNFEFEAEVMARKAANSGIFFHTRFQEKGWPEQGFEIQVNNTATGEGGYLERKKTASLYGVRDVYKQFVADDEWFRLRVVVRGRRVQVFLNDMMTVDYVEPDPAVQERGTPGRVLGHGTFALQCHDPGSKAFFRNLRVRPLAADLPAYDAAAPQADDAWREILSLHNRNYPVVDYHVHLKGGFTLEDALAQSRRNGIFYGIAINCGLNFPVQDDATAAEFVKSMQGKPVFIAMQAEGREWVRMFSKKTMGLFDYIFTDSMTWSDDSGKRMRTWIPAEVGQITDRQKFMDTLVNRAVGILTTEPVDIYANPTFIPDQIAQAYDELWTPERMDRIIEAAKKGNVAIEINNRYKIPSAAFIKRMKAAGLKFAFGTNNTDANFGRVDYGRQMVRECKLGWQDFFVPKPPGERAADRKSS